MRQLLFLTSILVLFSACGKTKDEYIWNQLTPEARDAINQQVQKECQTKLVESFKDITTSTLESYSDGGGDLRDGTSIDWKTSKGTDMAKIIILKLSGDEFYFYVKKGSSSLEAHGTTIQVKSVYKVTKKDNASVLSMLRALACNSNDDSSFDETSNTVKSAVYVGTNEDNRTETINTYVINPKIPAIFNLFAFAYDYKEIVEGDTSGENNFTQTFEIGSTVSFDTALKNEIKSAGVYHCTFAATTWTGTSLREPQPSPCAADGSLNNDLDEILP